MTKVMLNVGNPDRRSRSRSCRTMVSAWRARSSSSPAPFRCIHSPWSISTASLGPAKDKIAQLTRGYPHKPDYFVDRLAEGVGHIAAAFYPKDVIVRLSDFKTNEYAGLLGGEVFEPKKKIR